MAGEYADVDYWGDDYAGDDEFMADLAIRFPIDISFGATGGPGFQTVIVGSDSGFETADQRWETERSEYEVAHAARRYELAKKLLTFHRVARGKFNTWRFKDWVDFSATASEGVFVQLTSSTFQMYKKYTFDGESYLRKIAKPRPTVTITGGTSIVVDYVTGIVTALGSPANPPTAWAGEFDVHCRFDVDRLVYQIIDRNPTDGLIVGFSSIPIVEVRD